VLHIDRNNYYGGQSASLNLNQVRRRWQQAAAGGGGARRLRYLASLLQCAEALDVALQLLIMRRKLCTGIGCQLLLAAAVRSLRPAFGRATAARPPYPCPRCSCLSGSGRARSLPRSWAPAATTMSTWCPNSSW
jgi:hypothetical protein